MTDIDMAWHEEGICQTTDPEIFFPEGGGAGNAIKVCDGCPVKRRCLDHALTAGEDHGIWGGTTRNQRRRMTQQTA
ncbi:MULTISPECIES: WhiB family transcriptional regulator [unclassified Streptomyces]|uniref:WhiB family transcriptional regulator n=1 Tax=unclassified Streptomyces TaxID=2593676 RepID=UPI000BF08588|nr:MULTISPECIES: WhiB family transcriptional regulator [unclassified Streptomyces]